MGYACACNEQNLYYDIQFHSKNKLLNYLKILQAVIIDSYMPMQQMFCTSHYSNKIPQ